jgi:hypothetical protein
MSERQASFPYIEKGFTEQDDLDITVARMCRCGACEACVYARFANRVRRLSRNAPEQF